MLPPVLAGLDFGVTAAFSGTGENSGQEFDSV